MIKESISRLLLCGCLFLTGISVFAQEPPYKQSQLPIQERVDDLLKRMTLEEKIAQIRHIHSWNIFDGQTLDIEKLKSFSKGWGWGFVEGFPLTGANCRKNMQAIQKFMVEETRLGIPIFTVAESLHGSVHEGSVIYPQNVALGSTFNPELAYRKAAMITKDLHAQGMHQVLAPCIDVVRDLRWGRVEESYGEDPFLCGLFGIAEVEGYLDNGISPMLKHYGPHGNPLSGLNLASVECGLRDLHEVYLKPFEMVIKNTPVLAVMSTYNSWNRIPNSASEYLLTEVLRNQFGFKGYVYSDWGAIEMLKTFHHTARNGEEAALQAFSAGLDVEASSNCYPLLANLIKKGKLDEDILNESVRRVLYVKFKMGLFEDPYGEQYIQSKMHPKEGILLSKKIADESVVLLKNENNILPLDAEKLKSIAVIGPNADQVQFGDYTWSRNNKDGVTPLAGIRQLLEDKVSIHYEKGCDLVSLNTGGIKNAVEAARKSDVAIIFCGSASAALARDYKSSTCGEGFDLNDLSLTGVQHRLIKEVYATGTPVVLVLVTGKPFVISWEKDHIPAILTQWYAGEQAGNSIADILFGKVSPSGRLTFSFPRSTGHLPVYYNYLPSDKGFYKNPGSYESPGRDYVFSSPDPLFAFGHGLTYTSFVYNSLVTDKEHYNLSDTIYIKAGIKNIGKRQGREVVQLYVRDKVSTVVTPVKQLRDFKKVTVMPGNTQTVGLKVAVKDLYIVDNENKRVVEPGEFELQIGAASDNILQRKTIAVGDFEYTASEATANTVKSSKNIIIRGEIRDVQATLIDNVRIYANSSGKLLGKSDEKGRYKVEAGNHEILTFKKKGYQNIEVPVDNLEVINVRVNYGEN
ncbi:glycoside hydrolase family 3 C-terminal domain-containing protein [Coprobacter tertius]|uniref:Glycoside hydrolase family 3 C-terminal domain-containing protein n=1 Tax=Coprobacter tertius TaxID=2944915 RepID=A0ABT1MJI5_9BACT|nr:glycoside hydrolase family 3 C-terminal domain-containing protein [Coprobacter tertius]MCP9612778.1 glycoside hydrolase family 3 C-terminal domain-containing protein [Coprobacter tertius]